MFFLSASKHHRKLIMDPNAVARIARTLMRDHLNNSWSFAFNRRKGAAGLCDYDTNTIFISREWAMGATEADIRETMLHEIAHALTPGHKHDYIWRAKYVSLGGNGRRTSSTAGGVTYLYEGRCNCSSEVRFRAHRLGRIKVEGYCPQCLHSVTWTNTRTGQIQHVGGAVVSV